jgi:hypothetical protein
LTVAVGVGSNPHRVVAEDKRTPWEILQAIEEKGKEADAALSRLQTLVSPSKAVK